MLLTGCAGFIGSNLLDRLLADGYRVIGVDDFNDYYSPIQKRSNIARHLNDNNFTLIKSDISRLPRRYAPRNDETINIVIHLAARAGVRASIKEPLLYQKVNVGGTLKMLELAKELKVKHFIFGSSSSVYGNNTPVPFREDAACDQPISPYAATKRSGELLCFAYSHLYKIPTTVLRFFTVYGPRNRPDMAAFKFMDSIANEKPVDFYGQDTSRDYTYVDDIVNGILAAINFIPDNFDIFNLGNSSPTKLSEFINTIEEVVGKKAILVKKELPQGDVQTTFADISKAEKILKWKPKVNLKTGIEELWKWYKMADR
ncbi:GDP-mannose 4,6-dehydratase [Candidatus Collierbacteria bacterium]|nr:GDP-mannose 4,6-dehydratase [Candidatus Collierbacteria bacterium]